MKKSRRKLQSCTNQIGKGDGTPNFELVRPPDDNFFQLEVIQSKVLNSHMLLGKLHTGLS